jgi:hypothetical protein
MATISLLGVVESPDPTPSFTLALEDIERICRISEGTLTELFELAGRFSEFSKAYKNVISGAAQRIAAEILSDIDRMKLLITQAYGPAVAAFDRSPEPNIAALVEMLTSFDEAVGQLQIMPALEGLDTKADGSSAIRAISYTITQGDTLETIAFRLTGDSSNWVDIARYNDFNLGIVGSEDTLTDWIGRTISIPATTTNSPLKRDPAVWDAAIGTRALGRNFGLTLSTRTRSDGFVDIQVIDSTNTLLEGLSARLDTQLGAIPDNPDFGSYLPTIFGHSFGGMTDRMLEVHMRAALLADPRVEEVLDLQLTKEQDSIVAFFRIQAFNGITTNQLLASFNTSEAALLES